MLADPLRALFHVFDTGVLPPPEGRVLFINAQVCPGVQYLNPATTLMQQYFRPYQQALTRSGWKTSAEIPEEESFDAIIMHSARQQEENRYLLAAGLKILKPGGLLVAAAGNDSGGKRLRGEVADLGMECYEQVKHHARIIWGQRPEKPDIAAALEAGGYQKVLDGQFISRPGMFCWNRIDAGSRLLAGILPEDMPGRGADFGCGYGYLSAQALNKKPGPDALHLIDADWRAVESCRRRFGPLPFLHYIWADITDKGDSLPDGLDWIVMNPPFHEGKATQADVGRAFIKHAAGALRRGGTLWRIATTHLPYEEVLAEAFAWHEQVKRDQGYKIIMAEKS